MRSFFREGATLVHTHEDGSRTKQQLPSINAAKRESRMLQSNRDSAGLSKARIPYVRS